MKTHSSVILPTQSTSIENHSFLNRFVSSQFVVEEQQQSLLAPGCCSSLEEEGQLAAAPRPTSSTVAYENFLEKIF